MTCNPRELHGFIGHPTCSCLVSMFQRHPTSTRLFRLHAATQGDKAAIFCESHNDQARQLEDVSEHGHGEGTEWHGGTGSFVASRTVPSCGMVACHGTHVVAPMVGWCWMVCNTAGLDDFFRPQQSYAQCLEPGISCERALQRKLNQHLSPHCPSPLRVCPKWISPRPKFGKNIETAPTLDCFFQDMLGKIS